MTVQFHPLPDGPFSIVYAESRMFPEQRKIELFARSKPSGSEWFVDKWSYWGNEI